MNFVKVPNKLIYGYCRELFPNSIYMYMVILDKMWNEPGKKYAFGSDRTLSEWTGIRRRHIHKYRQELIKAELIRYIPQGTVYGDYDEKFKDMKSRYYPQLVAGNRNYICVPKDEILYNKQLKSNEKLVYILLLAILNKQKGYAYPSQAYMANTLGISKSTIKRIISELEQKNFISVIRDDWNGSRTVNKYKPMYSIKQEAASMAF